MLTMRPPSLSSGSSACVRKNGPFGWTFISVSNCASVASGAAAETAAAAGDDCDGGGVHAKLLQKRRCGDGTNSGQRVAVDKVAGADRIVPPARTIRHGPRIAHHLCPRRRTRQLHA